MLCWKKMFESLKWFFCFNLTGLLGPFVHRVCRSSENCWLQFSLNICLYTPTWSEYTNTTRQQQRQMKMSSYYKVFQHLGTHFIQILIYLHCMCLMLPTRQPSTIIIFQDHTASLPDCSKSSSLICADSLQCPLNFWIHDFYQKATSSNLNISNIFARQIF